MQVADLTSFTLASCPEGKKSVVGGGSSTWEGMAGTVESAIHHLFQIRIQEQLGHRGPRGAVKETLLLREGGQARGGRAGEY